MYIIVDPIFCFKLFAIAAVFCEHIQVVGAHEISSISKSSG